MSHKKIGGLGVASLAVICCKAGSKPLKIYIAKGREHSCE